MSKKKIIWLFVLLVITAGGWYGYKEYTRTNKDLSKVTADISISAVSLVKEFEINDSVANKKYSGKIIETDGNVKSIEKDDKGYYTIVLGDTNSMSSVRCPVDTIHSKDAAQLKTGSSAIIRGVCTGFKKNELLGENLGSDVELNRCVVIIKK